MHILNSIRKLAKTLRAQNSFSISKELHTVRLFRNDCDLSRLQEEYLMYLYIYESIARDVVIEKISKHVYDKELYEDCYLLWKREKGFKHDGNNSNQEVKLVKGTTIKFPKPGEK